MGAASIPQLPWLSGQAVEGALLCVALVHSEPGCFPPPLLAGLLLLGKCWLPPPHKEPVMWVSENDAYIKLSSAGETD